MNYLKKIIKYSIKKAMVVIRELQIYKKILHYFLV